MAPGNDEQPLPKSKQKVSFAEGDEAAVVAAAEEEPTTTTTAATTPAPSTSSDLAAGKPASRSSLSIERPSIATRESEVLRATARESLAMLLEGNARFCSGKLERCRADPEALADGASDDRGHPTAVVLACSDARAPPELLFDAALGELHVVRVAGGGVSSSSSPSSSSGGGGHGGSDSFKNDVVLASVLDGVLRGGARCVVVLGHSRCDAVRVAIEGWALEARRKAAAAAAAATAAGAAGGNDPSSLAACCPSSSAPAAASSSSSSPFASAAQSPAPSPIKAAAATPHHSKRGGGSKKPGGGGFFSRLFNRKKSSAASASAALPASPDASGSGGGGGANAAPGRRRTSSSLDRPLSSSSQGATAAAAAGEAGRGGSAHGGNENSSSHHGGQNHPQPLAAIADALAGAVEAVARGVSSGGRFAKLASSLAASSSANNLASSAAADEDGREEDEGEGAGGTKSGGGGDDEGSRRRAAAAVALRSQDSIGIAHARFARQRAQVACDEAEAEECLDDVVDEHVRRTVAVVLQALMRAADAATARSVEVVGARADLASGRVAVLRTGWVSARGGALYE